MGRFGLVAICVVFAAAVFAQHQHSTPPKETTAVLESGLGELHHPVSTTNPQAQKFFDQGMTFIYAFNHDEAIRSFKRAAELDPNLAMAHWGIALALGPNINLDVDPEREKAAYEAVQKALSLAGNAPQHERDYIETLAKRYSNDPKADLKKLAVDYKNAMGELVRKYPDDLDLATLYAESAMDLRPWQLWSNDGHPAEGTEEILSVLEEVLRRDPDHVGANHYYIHAVEASRHPERALPSAERLKKLVPAAGHLVHMPAHIFMRTGDYRQAAESNARAADVDRAYIAKRGSEGFYPLLYFNHNLHFLSSAHAMEGRLSDAMKAAEELARNIAPVAREMAMVQGPTAWPVLTLVRFSRWDDVLKSPDPAVGPQAAALRHFARGAAEAATGSVQEAQKEEKVFLAASSQVGPDDLFMLNKARDILAVAQVVLAARIAAAKNDSDSAITFFRTAAEMEDRLQYDEPPDWPLPVRESLGGYLLRLKQYEQAEEVFRQDLERNRRNPRSLFGLSQALRGQGKTGAAQAVQREFERAWRRADRPLRVEDL